MIFNRLTKLIQKVFSGPIPPSVQSHRVIPWFKVNGDKTLRLDYDLAPDSIVFDLGGYEGQWASDIYSKYRCRIFVFEPYLPYAENIKNRFVRNSDISVFEVGLSGSTKEEILNVCQDSSSAYRGDDSLSTVIRLEEAVSFFNKNKIDEIDLMKINIEGGEYDLLEHLIHVNWITKIKNIQVQFHDFVPHADQRMAIIQKKLLQTHETTYAYEYVWENWKRIK